MDRLILFDVDGTLIDTAGAGKTALFRAFAATFAVGDEIEARTRHVRFAGMTDPAILGAMARALGFSDRMADHAESLEAHYLTALEDEMARDDPRRRVIPGVRELLEALDGDVVLGLVTGNIEAGARLKLEPFGLNRYFPGGGFGSDHADRREVARTAVDRLSEHVGRTFAPTDVTVVGDTEHDVDCARANGYRAVAIATGWVDRDTLEAARPDAILDTFEDRASSLEALGL